MPLVLQNLITTSLSFTDTFMVGLLGQEQMSAVTVANAPIFVIQLFVFGMQSGSSVLFSQFWGKKDQKSVSHVLGVGLYSALIVSSVFAAAMVFIPNSILRLATDNATLIEIAKPYLQIVGASYVFSAISGTYIAMQRSTGNSLFGMQVFAISMAFNTILNYILIFGKFGFKAYGVVGAAVATCLSHVLEFVITVFHGFFSKRVKLYPKLILKPAGSYWKSFVKNSSPVVCNETLWDSAPRP